MGDIPKNNLEFSLEKLISITVLLLMRPKFYFCPLILDHGPPVKMTVSNFTSLIK